jgi:RNA polymerase sigma-70 factor (ECF subfamily)
LSTLRNVHVATVKRQLAAARESLQRALRANLTQRLKVSPDELESILRLVQSRFQITVRRLLDDQAP